jgi:tetratricopeptide (TPR) repeat protein
MTKPEDAAQLASFVMHSQPGTCTQVFGETHMNRWMFLHELQSRLSTNGIAPILVMPPIQALDTGCAAMLQIGQGLHAAGLINGELETIKNPSISWDVKFDLIKQRVQARSEQVTLLFDEPGAWRISGTKLAHDAAYNNRHTTSIAEWIRVEAPCRRVETTAAWSPDPAERVLPSEWAEYSRQIDFGPFSHIADNLKQRLRGWLQTTSLDQRLLVALAVVTSEEEVISNRDIRRSNEDLAPRLLAAMTNDVRLSSLLFVLRTLAIVRGPLFPELIGLLYKYGKKSTPDPQVNRTLFKLLEFVLLVREDSLVLFHPVLQSMLRHEPNAQYESPVAAHRIALDAYTERIYGEHMFRQWGNVYPVYDFFDYDFWESKPISRTQSEFEAFYHASNCGDAVRHDPFGLRIRHYFADQLLYRAQALSAQSKQNEAAEAFREVVTLDEQNDFAHHYWAFNLDRAAGDRRVVEQEYLRAIELNPTHPWRWSRWINFLITVGRIPEAREQWKRALEALPFEGNDNDLWIFEGLHLLVARLLLHRAQLEFATEVLAGVPDIIRGEHKGFRALGRLLKGLTIARDERGVFPAEIDPDQYWTRSHLDFPETHKGLRLIQWNPARVDSVNEHIVCLIVGKHDHATKSTIYGRVELGVAQFEAACPGQLASELAPGRLLELAFYGENGLLQIRIHPDIPYSDPDLPPLDPPNPRRYLEKEAVAI